MAKLNAFYRMVQQNPIIISSLFMELNPNPMGTLLQIEGNETLNEIDKDILQFVYYGSNSFIVSWDALQQFLAISLHSTNHLSMIGPLLRRITIRYDTRLYSAYQQIEKARTLSLELWRLFQLSNVDMITLEIMGDGTPEGSDLDTQVVLLELAVVVGNLFEFFGPRFTIQKTFGLQILGNSIKTTNLGHYWIHPLGPSIEKYSNGDLTFTQLMRIEVDLRLRQWQYADLSASWEMSNVGNMPTQQLLEPALVSSNQPINNADALVVYSLS